MNKKLKFTLLALVIGGALTAFVGYLRGRNIPVLSPDGAIGVKERHLIVLAILLSLIVVIPVYVMLVSFAWRYREGNRNRGKYEPNFDHSRLLESIWWAVPLAIISVLAVATWKSSHELDPFKSLSSNNKPLQIQVVALNWKWLFIYPQQGIAAVNFVQFPVNTPLDFEITADAPMNSFWIPQLGGQIYAMSGMATQLHLIANRAGSYHGSSANISGEGFAGMDFTAKASSNTEFRDWVSAAKQTTQPLSQISYNDLAKPSKDNPVRYFSSVDQELFNSVIAKFLLPSHSTGLLGGS